ncbi:MAG: ribokinase [Chlorobia bacterium]|nr:ribokinase [Fimbriimonadaceae bacterium]
MAAVVPEVVVIGSANMDLVTRAPRFPLPGETVLGSKFTTFTGGKGANQACAIAKLGGRPRFIGKVGNDSFGLQIISSLRQIGVDTANVFAEQDLVTGTAMITVTDSGENTIVVAGGANARVDPDFVNERLSKFEFNTVLMQLETPVSTVQEIIRKKKLAILNPAPASDLPDEIYHGLDWITPNETETHRLTGVRPIDTESCRKAAAWFLQHGVKNVVITLGAKGSFLVNSQIEIHCPTIEVKTIDTTAAGDAFNGALAQFLNEGRDGQNAVMLANRAGALATTKLGAQASLPSRDELRAVSSGLF